MISVEIKGMDELNEKLKKLSSALQEKAIGEALYAGALIVESYAKIEAKVDTGFMRNSIYTVAPGQSDYSQRMAEAKAANSVPRPMPQVTPQPLTAVVAVAAEYATAVEYRVKPFMRPAVDNHLREIEQAIGENLKAAVERAL